MPTSDRIEAARGPSKSKDAISPRGWLGIFVAAFLVVGALLVWDALTPGRRTTEDIETTIAKDIRSRGLADGR